MHWTGTVRRFEDIPKALHCIAFCSVGWRLLNQIRRWDASMSIYGIERDAKNANCSVILLATELSHNCEL